jgi:hypothetical protein
MRVYSLHVIIYRSFSASLASRTIQKGGDVGRGISRTAARANADMSPVTLLHSGLATVKLTSFVALSKLGIMFMQHGWKQQ